MDRFGDELLAHAAFADQQHTRFRGRNPLHEREYTMNRRGGAN
jgi:hypothetical protein